MESSTKTKAKSIDIVGALTHATRAVVLAAAAAAAVGIILNDHHDDTRAFRME